MGDHPGPLHGEDSPQACDEGGQACQDHCEGLLRGRSEEEHLNLSCMFGRALLVLACCAQWETCWHGASSGTCRVQESGGLGEAPREAGDKYIFRFLKMVVVK